MSTSWEVDPNSAGILIRHNGGVYAVRTKVRPRAGGLEGEIVRVLIPDATELIPRVVVKYGDNGSVVEDVGDLRLIQERPSDPPTPDPVMPVTADSIGHTPVLCLRPQGGYVTIFCADPGVSPESFLDHLRQNNPGWSFVPLTHEELISALKAWPE